MSSSFPTQILSHSRPACEGGEPCAARTETQTNRLVSRGSEPVSLRFFVCVVFGVGVFSGGLFSVGARPANAELMAGAAIVDVTPDQLPVLINGGMLSRTADSVKTRVNARAIVLSDGEERIGIVVVDSCMLPRMLIDDAKQLAASRTKLSPDRILVSATHTHTAPSAFGALGTDADPNYVPLIRQRIAEALVAAEARLQPARVGWGSGPAGDFTALRRWVRRPDRLDLDPFGNPTVRANMHAARDLENVTGETGPEDPELSIIAFESVEGEPIAALANFSMHYFSDKPISADYFGLFCDGLQEYVESKHPGCSMVGIMSHGCSGDIWRRDYMQPNRDDSITIDGYAQGLLSVAAKIYDSIEYVDHADLEMAQAVLPMKYRTPNQQLLNWSQEVVDGMDGGVPKDRTEVYAREQVLLDQMQHTEIVVQAIRIGNIAIATTPNETYALTGFKLKRRSPLERTMVIELANGADGYIPPPEQHQLGGYNTWAARSAGLEVTAEPRIVATGLGLLEEVCGKPRRQDVQSVGIAAERLLAAGPVAYWRLSEMEAPAAIDHSPHHRDGIYEPGVCFYLEGPKAFGFTAEGDVNRCVHFAGGRMRARLDSLRDTYTVVMQVWNGMPIEARETTGWLFSRDHAASTSFAGEHLGLGGTATRPGRLLVQRGHHEPLVGATELERWRWHRVVLISEPSRVRVYLDGNREPEIDAELPAMASSIASCFIGGRSDGDSNWEGRIDEVAVYDRVVSPDDLW